MERNHIPPTWFLTVVVAAIAVLASACGSTETSVAGVGTTAVPTASTSETEADLGFGLREFGLTDEQWTRAVEGVQADIAACMAAAGFEYIPADVDTVELAMSAVRTEPGMDRRQYKEQWGYGVTTRFDNRVKEIELGEANLAIFDSLGEADQVAYERTLYGEDSDATFAFQFDEEIFEPTGGCTADAIDANLPPELLDPDFVNPKDVLLEADPRYEAADLGWVDCMGNAGYDYEDQDEIIEEYQDRLDELLGDLDPEELSSSQAAELTELQAEEVAVSLVDLDCQGPVDEIVKALEIELFGRQVSF